MKQKFEPGLIFLIGMPLSGKSSFGKRLAKALQLVFIDLDKEIEKVEKMAIADIFHHKSEAHFRALEHDALKNVITFNHQAVIACGGGTPMFHQNIHLMLQNGLVIYLEAEVDLLLKRATSENTSKRPLLSSADETKNRLENLLISRKMVYEQAHVRIQARFPAEKNIELLLRDYIEIKKC
ncbi:MAG: shikimate kinase [Flavobacteriales bacterium]